MEQYFQYRVLLLCLRVIKVIIIIPVLTLLISLIAVKKEGLIDRVSKSGVTVRPSRAAILAIRFHRKITLYVFPSLPYSNLISLSTMGKFAYS